MSHGFVSTGLTFPNATTQTTYGAITPPGAFALITGGVGNIPSGWLLCDASYKKTDYPALYSVIGNESNVSQIPAFSSISKTEYYNATLNVSTGDRRVDRIATDNAGRWMVLGDAGQIYYTANNGASWTALGAPTGVGDLYTICYGGGRWVVGGASKIWYSANNGTTWTSGTGVLAQSFYGSAYNSQSNLFLFSTSAGYYQRSTDGGATWTDLGLNLADRVYKLAWGLGYFVAGSNGSNLQWSSNNGSTWNDFGAVVGSDNVNKMRFANGRFFGVGDNGNVMYTKPNSNPSLASSWFWLDLPIRGGTYDTTSELTDVSYDSVTGTWIIGTNTTTTTYWAPDYGQDYLEFYLASGSNSPNGTQAYNDAWAAGGYYMVVGAYDSVNLSYAVVTYNMNTVPTPPSTHFWVSANYQSQGSYNGSVPTNIVKT